MLRNLIAAGAAYQQTTWRNVRVSYINLWGWALFAFFVMPFMMWITLQTYDSGSWRFLNLFPTMIGTVVILHFGLRPTNVGWAGIIGGVYAVFMSKGQSPHIAAGLLWLWQLVASCAFGFFFIGLTLSTWDFSEEPGAFWLMYAIIAGFYLWQGTFGIKSRWAVYLTGIYMLACFVMAIWTTFDGLYKGKAFDGANGEPLYMMDTDGQEDTLGRTPVDCRPAGTAHHGFDYAVAGTCFSTRNGKRLVPMDAKTAESLDIQGRVAGAVIKTGKAVEAVARSVPDISLPGRTVHIANLNDADEFRLVLKTDDVIRTVFRQPVVGKCNSLTYIVDDDWKDEHDVTASEVEIIERTKIDMMIREYKLTPAYKARFGEEGIPVMIRHRERTC